MPNPKLLHLCFSLDHQRDQAVARFREVFGVEPRDVYADNAMLRVGPVPQAQDEPQQLELI